MEVTLSARCRIGLLYNRRRSVYLCLTVGRRHWFLSRWDTVRVFAKAHQYTLHRGPDMTWYCGLFTV